MPESPGTQQLRNMVREAIVEGTRNEGYGPFVQPDAATDRVMKIIDSVHANARSYGRLLGEEAVLDALIEGTLGKPAQRHWWERVKAKIEQAQR